ncbi:MAG TPA: LLM class flavin-dependent oxidoreductase [Actinotalea caeni]|uniref:LLM class flavin-dependent oxidoreductase n=1 Tax=Actinotalea caeni TaxID=1348467 RepID=UPI0012E30E4A|nr:LLM class flavin-dependent oxidoreductase [Actinotalea caeni]HLV54259.1 LLM class flavin-dependent oxidoreductase [Actinotalea caeni]
MTSTGLIFPPDQPPERLRSVAHRTETAGIPELWLWEDCFAESGVAPAAAALAWTERLQVGIGLLPVPLRNVALTAMELATLARMFPDRLLPGIGHGVLDWMGQVGARAASPLTLLEEYGSALRRLLDGETVTTEGRYVTLEQVGLRWPPARLPVYVGAIGPKTLAVAGRVGDGVILTSDTRDIGEALATARSARAAAGVEGPFEAVVFLSAPVDVGIAELTDAVGAAAAAGATRVAVCGTSPEGPPDGSERIYDLLEVVAEVAATTPA